MMCQAFSSGSSDPTTVHDIDIEHCVMACDAMLRHWSIQSCLDVLNPVLIGVQYTEAETAMTGFGGSSLPLGASIMLAEAVLSSVITWAGDLARRVQGSFCSSRASGAEHA